MSDQWYYMLGGQELGPLKIDELIDYVEHEQLTADDEVKLGEQGKWRRVGSIGRLMAAIPYQAVEKNIVPTPPKSSTPVAEPPTVDDFNDLSDQVRDLDESDLDDGSTLEQEPVADAAVTYQAAYADARARIVESILAQAEATYHAAEEQAKSHVAWASAPKVDRQWWGWASGVEFGPVEFNQVFGLAKSGQLKPTDLIRNGQFGHFGPSANVPGLFNAVGMIARATQTLALAKAQAQAAVAIAIPDAVPDPAVMRVTPARQPQPAQVPLPSVARQGTGADRDLQKTKQPQSDPVIHPVARHRESPDPETPAVRERSARTESEHSRPSSPPEPRPCLTASPQYGGMSSGSTPASRPVTPPPRKMESKPIRSSGPSWISGVIDQLKEPKAIGSLATIALIVLIFGWSYLPKSKAADIKRYQALKQIQDELRVAGENPAARAALSTKATKLGKEIAEAVKKQASVDEPAKQYLLWAARDEIPRMFSGATETQAGAEQNFASRLQEAAVALGLEKRSAVPAVAQQAPLPDD
ncbi:MAG: DUF4339 domain-containing protein [Planctomycetes bacterium]|nr:DUF4339 domain-containing protein [Planctomycetota bacterium]